MKSMSLKIILNLIMSIGIWVFVTNSHESGADERILAGVGGVLMLSSLLIRDFFSEDFKIKKIWSFISIGLACLGIYIFIYNVLESDWDSRIWLGFGLSIGFLGLSIREIMCKSEKQILLSQKKDLICCTAFIILFSLYGVIINNLVDIEYMKNDIRNIESIVQDIDENTKYLE